MAKKKDRTRRRELSEGGLNSLIFGIPAVVSALVWLLIQAGGSPARLSVLIERLLAGEFPATTTTWPSLLFVLVIYLLLSVSGYAVRHRVRTADFKRKSAESADAASLCESRYAALFSRFTRAQRELNGSILATNQIVNRLYAIDTPRWRFTKVLGRYEIDAECDGRVELLYHIEAGPEAAHVWKFDIDADESASPIAWLDEIDFKLESLDSLEGKDAKYLVFENGPRSKRVAIFFLPEIKQNETRKIKITYKWPGLARDLLANNLTRFKHSFRTYDPKGTAEIEYRYLFAAELGELTFERLSNKSPTDSVSEISDPAMSFTGWKFADSTLTMDIERLEFAVTRTGAGP